jgi:hypothetical protein
MKLRIHGNSIRFRLGRREVARLAEHGLIEQTIQLGQNTANQLCYSLRAKKEHTPPDCAFENNRMVVHVSVEDIRRWAATDQVEISARQSVSGGELEILIEKDFQCLDGPADALEEDAFPNPQRLESF